MKKSVVVIPTYNAKKSIERLLREVLQYVPLSQIIVVDDNSPDGTANEIKKHFLRDRRIKLIIRKKKGFIVLTEISYQIYKKKVIFGEIPINFIPVDLNKSNLNMKEIKEALFTVLRLKMNSFFKI